MKVIECKWKGIQQHKSLKTFPPLMVSITSKELISNLPIIAPTIKWKLFIHVNKGLLDRTSIAHHQIINNNCKIVTLTNGINNLLTINSLGCCEVTIIHHSYKVTCLK
jgi:hypothetical protein